MQLAERVDFVTEAGDPVGPLSCSARLLAPFPLEGAEPGKILVDLSRQAAALQLFSEFGGECCLSEIVAGAFHNMLPAPVPVFGLALLFLPPAVVFHGADFQLAHHCGQLVLQRAGPGVAELGGASIAAVATLDYDPQASAKMRR